MLRAALCTLLLAACAVAPDADGAGGANPGDTVSAPARPVDVPTAAGAPGAGEVRHVVYVPVYSRIYLRGERRTLNLAVTLSIRNTDPEHPLTLSMVQYYNSAGGFVRGHLRAPVRLAPMASMEYVVPNTDATGGSGANFIVEWRGTPRVTEPVIEAVMIGTAGQLGISFTSPGRTLERP
jgi:hypothetical protein